MLTQTKYYGGSYYGFVDKLNEIKENLWIIFILLFFTFILIYPPNTLRAQVQHSESFDGTTFPPSGWTVQLEAGSVNWLRYTATQYPSGYLPHSGAGMAGYDCYNQPAPGFSDLITPAFDLRSRGSNPDSIVFWFFRGNTWTTADSIGIYVNTSASITGATWLGNITVYNGLSPAWYRFAYSIPASFNGAANYIIFRASSSYWNDIFLDDVQWTSYPLPQPKYYGGSYDGFTDSSSSLTNLNGSGSQLSAKYYGGSYDGFADSSSSLTNLNGSGSQLSAKYYGGSYDGFADSSTLLITLNGIGSQLSAKYYGGSYDGFADSSTLLITLNGSGSQLSAKYYGGSYDGFADSSTLLITLNGSGSQLSSKYYGGSYDGFADSSTLLITLNGGGSQMLAKYFGGSYDGFADSTSLLTNIGGFALSLNISALIQGFYNSNTNTMVGDTISVYLHSSTDPPYAIIDSAKGFLDSTGNTRINFYKAATSYYYIVIKHRNSIETWSKSGGQYLASGSLNSYDFTSSQSQAYGNNMIQKGTKWCIYSGDVNQDGVVDGTDLSLVDNDAFNFVTGYVPTDVNGDRVVDGSDLSIADNNVSNFIAVIKPPGAGNTVELKIIKKSKSSSR